MSDTLDLTSFNRTVEAFVNNIPKRVSQAQRKIVLDILAGVVRRTPVDTGRARGNWQVSIGQPATGETGVTLTKRHKAAPKDEVAKLSKMPRFTVAWVVNNVPYIDTLEFGQFMPKDPGPSKDPRKGRKGRVLVKGGYSVQAPQGMMRVTLAQIEAELQKMLDEF